MVKLVGALTQIREIKFRGCWGANGRTMWHYGVASDTEVNHTGLYVCVWACVGGWLMLAWPFIQWFVLRPISQQPFLS